MELKIESKSAKATYDISNIIDGEVTLTTERTGTPGKLDFTLVKNGDINYHEGDRALLSMEDLEGKQVDMFCGYVFRKSKNLLDIKTTCYDQLRHLKAKQSYNFEPMTVTGVVNIIAKEFSLKIGTLEPTGYILQPTLYEDQTLIDIITACVSRTVVDTGRMYIFYDDFGKLALKSAENMRGNCIIGNKSFAMDYTYDTSIDESYNYIKLVQPNDKTKIGDAYVAQDSVAMKRWGKLQYYERVEEALNEAQIKEKVKMYLQYYCQPQRTLKLTSVGIPSMRAGCMVVIDIADLGDIRLNKMLLVDKCTHHIKSNSHTMDLELRVHNG